MKFLFVISLYILSVNHLYSQKIYFSTIQGIWEINLDDCSLDFLANCDRTLFDISFHPDGTLYGISGNEKLFSINLLNGTTSIKHSFDDEGFTSLTIDADGIMYLLGVSRNIWTYDITTDSATNLGNTGFAASGDLTFYEGELYAAVSGSRIARINLENPSLSEIAIHNTPQHIFGIVSDFVGCNEINTYVTTNDSSSIYKVDFENNSFEFICQLHISITGGASTSEFLASIPIETGLLTGNNPDCNNEGGEIGIPEGNGYGQLEYSLDGQLFQPDSLFSSLNAGSYMVYIRDEVGCIDSNMITLNLPEAPIIESITTESSTCGENNGSVLVFVINGTAPLQYSIDNINFQSHGLFENLSPGDYQLLVTDAEGCTVQAITTIQSTFENGIISTAITDATCGRSNGEISIEVNPADAITFSLDGINFQSVSIFENLPPKSYLVYVKDVNGCIDSLVLTIHVGDFPIIESINLRPELCGMTNGYLEIIATGGTGPYQYSLDGTSYQASNEFDQLESSVYTTYILDADTCSAQLDVVIDELTGPRILDIKMTPSECGMNTGLILLEIDGGIEPVMGSIDGGLLQADLSFSDLSPGQYMIDVIDAAGCHDQRIIHIAQQGCPFFIPNIFSPNGDGINDYFEIQTPAGSQLVIEEFLIFDRWGTSLFQKLNLPVHSIQAHWDGTFKSMAVSPGVYAYSIRVRFENGTSETFNGDITLVR